MQKIESIKINLESEYTPTMKWVKFDDDPCLKRISEPVTELEESDIETIKKMVKYVDACYNDESSKYKIKNGIAIAAPQLGLNKRIIYVHFKDRDIEHKYLLINPKIIAFGNYSSFVENGEGCLSVTKDVKANIERSYKIIVEGYDLFKNKTIEIAANELLSICFQHEIDHLDGILYTDRVNKKKAMYINSTWFKI